MPTFFLKGNALYFRLQMIESRLSDSRKTHSTLLLFNLIFIEELSPIKQAKREKLPVFAYFSGKAFINLDEESLFLALEEGIIEDLVHDTPLLIPFMQDALERFKWLPQE